MNRDRKRLATDEEKSRVLAWRNSNASNDSATADHFSSAEFSVSARTVRRWRKAVQGCTDACSQSSGSTLLSTDYTPQHGSSRSSACFMNYSDHSSENALRLQLDPDRSPELSPIPIASVASDNSSLNTEWFGDRGELPFNCTQGPAPAVNRRLSFSSGTSTSFSVYSDQLVNVATKGVSADTPRLVYNDDLVKLRRKGVPSNRSKVSQQAAAAVTMATKEMVPKTSVSVSAMEDLKEDLRKTRREVCRVYEHLSFVCAFNGLDNNFDVDSRIREAINADKRQYPQLYKDIQSGEVKAQRWREFAAANSRRRRRSHAFHPTNSIRPRFL